MFVELADEIPLVIPVNVAVLTLNAFVYLDCLASQQTNCLSEGHSVSEA